MRAQNLALPGGRINEGQREATVRTLGRIIDPEEFNELVVATRAGYPIKVRDLVRSS